MKLLNSNLKIEIEKGEFNGLEKDCNDIIEDWIFKNNADNKENLKKLLSFCEDIVSIQKNTSTSSITVSIMELNVSIENSKNVFADFLYYQKKTGKRMNYFYNLFALIFVVKMPSFDD